jgi:ComF family protein
MNLRPLLDVLAPPVCAGCGAHAGAAEPLCAACRGQLRWLGAEPLQVPLDQGVLDAGAGAPLRDARAPGAAGVLLAWAPLAYEGPVRGVVGAVKFRGASGAAGAMAAQVAANAPPGWLEPPAELVPVPLHPARARRRGYNQAGLLAAAIGRRSGLNTSDCLERTGPARTQVGRDRGQRLSGIAGSIRLAPGRAPPARAIVVDDVITTGATLAACARALLAGGAAEARAVGYARTPGR